MNYFKTTVLSAALTALPVGFGNPPGGQAGMSLAQDLRRPS
jgi:hypothetical protein